jgi:2-iminobutanoate/2-iminopropanoate deaminase
MMTVRNPEGGAPPENYHHGVEVSGAVRTLYIAGQIGSLPDGTVPDGIDAQTRGVYANMEAVLKAAKMSFVDIVKTTVFLVNPADRAAFGTLRSELTKGAKNASTLVFVSSLALPQLLVEVEAIAVQPLKSDEMH